MVFFFNNLLVNSNQTITLFSNVNATYPIICSSINSKPDVSLIMYDTNRLISLSTSSNSITQKTCSADNRCTNVLLVNFLFPNGLFNSSLTSISCSADSIIPNVPLNSLISRNVTVISNNNIF
jgi:hypothetical protein